MVEPSFLARKHGNKNQNGSKAQKIHFEIKLGIVLDRPDQRADTHNKENIEKEGIFNFINVQKLLKNNDENKYDASYSILSLMAIKSWYNDDPN